MNTETIKQKIAEIDAEIMREISKDANCIITHLIDLRVGLQLSIKFRKVA